MDMNQGLLTYIPYAIPGQILSHTKKDNTIETKFEA